MKWVELQLNTANIILWVISSIVLFFPMFLWVLFAEFILFSLEYKLFHTGYLYNQLGYILLFSSFWISLAFFGKTMKDKLKMMFLLCVATPSIMYVFIGLYTVVVPHEYITKYRVIEVEKTAPKEKLPKRLEQIVKLPSYSSTRWDYHKESGHFLVIAPIGNANSYEISFYDMVDSKAEKIVIQSKNNEFYPYFSPKGDFVALVTDGYHNYEDPKSQELWIYQWHTKKIKKLLKASSHSWRHCDYESEDLKPRWLSDYKHIVVGDNNFGYTLVDLESFETKRVTGYNSSFKSKGIE